MQGIDKRVSKDGTVSYRARVRVKGHPTITKTFSVHTLAKKWKKQTEVELDKGRYFDKAESKKHTLSEAIDRYIKNILPNKPKDAKNVHRHLIWWKKELGSYTLDRIKPSMISEKADLLSSAQIKKGQKRAPATVVRYLSSLSHLFSVMSKDWGWITDNPMLRVSKPSVSNARTRFLSKDEKPRLLEACRQSTCSVLYLVVVLALSTGMRYSEIMELKKSDIDVDSGVITLRETKNGDTRSVPLVGEPLLLLKERICSMSKDALIFPSANNPNKPIDIRSSYERAVKRANISDFRFHDLRHTVASYLAMDGYSLLDVGTLLGHKDLQSTKRYSHMSQEHKRKMVVTMTEKLLG